MKAVITANGMLEPNIRLRELWRDADLRIAADGGALNARQHLGLAPHVIIGDMDSLDDETAQWLDDADVEKIQHPRDKNETDLELAIQLAQARGAIEIVVLAAVGGRPDQMLANVLLLTRTPGLRLSDAHSEIWVTKDESEIKGKIGEIVSLIPLSTQVEGITTHGLAYPLNNETLALGTTRGVSNELVAPIASIKIDRGMLLLVHLLEVSP